MVKMEDPLGEQRLILGGPATVPLVVRASTAFWLASALVAGVLPVILEFGGGARSTPDWAMVVLAVPLVALQVWGAFWLLAGIRWVRTVLTIIAVLSALGAPFELSPVVVTGLVLTLAGAVLMWLPPANAFFRGQYEAAGSAR